MGDDELTCNPKKTTTASSHLSEDTAATFPPQPIKPSSRILTRPTQEPDIIWSVPITQSAKIKTKLPQMKQPMSNDDTLIIGIVGGVVAFIAILIIIICIVRLRMTGPHYPNTHIMPMPMGPGSVQLSYKNAPTMYAVPPYAAQSYATLPHKMSSSSQPSLRQNFSTIGRMPVNAQQQQQQQPYYIYQDDKAYR